MRSCTVQGVGTWEMDFRLSMLETGGTSGLFCCKSSGFYCGDELYGTIGGSMKEGRRCWFLVRGGMMSFGL